MRDLSPRERLKSIERRLSKLVAEVDQIKVDLAERPTRQGGSVFDAPQSRLRIASRLTTAIRGSSGLTIEDMTGVLGIKLPVDLIRSILSDLIEMGTITRRDDQYFFASDQVNKIKYFE